MIVQESAENNNADGQ